MAPASSPHGDAGSRRNEHASTPCGCPDTRSGYLRLSRERQDQSLSDYIFFERVRLEAEVEYLKAHLGELSQSLGQSDCS